MTDRECIKFLQWALPTMRMRWRGFRKVRGQVCKRISRRITALGLPGVDDYRTCLQANPDEWVTLASLCRVTISRFYRDRYVFDQIGDVVLPRLAEWAEAEVRCWCVGCAKPPLLALDPMLDRRYGAGPVSGFGVNGIAWCTTAAFQF